MYSQSQLRKKCLFYEKISKSWICGNTSSWKMFCQLIRENWSSRNILLWLQEMKLNNCGGLLSSVHSGSDFQLFRNTAVRKVLEEFGWLDKLIVRLQQGCFSTGVKVCDILQTASPKFQNKAFSGHLQCLPHYECFIPGFASDNYCIYKPIILKLACLIGVSCIEYVINWAKWFWCWWFFGANYLAMKTLSDI